MKIDWIEQGILAASGVPIGVKDIEALYEQGIRAIVTLTENPLTTQREITTELLDKLEITALHVPVTDQHPPNEQQVQQVRQFVDQMQAQGKAVFMHCAAGIGRTGTMLHAYYLAGGMSLDDAKQKVRTARRSSAFLMLTPIQQAFLNGLAQKSSAKRVSPFPATRYLSRNDFKLQFVVADDQSVEATVFLDGTLQGPPGMVHGGALASLLDEAMTVGAFEAQRFGFTANLNVDYCAPVPIETTVKVMACVERVEGKKTFMMGTVKLPDGTVSAEGRGLFIFNQVMNDGLRSMLGVE